MAKRRAPRLSRRPLRAFRKTLDRVDALLNLHPILHGTQGRPRQTVADVMRGALVLGFAGLDALVVDSVVVAVPVLARVKDGLGPNVEKWVDARPGAVVQALAEDDPWHALGDLCAEELGRQTFQRSVAIEGVLWDVLKCPAPWSRVVKQLDEAMPEMTEERVVELLDDYVERRNRIVHGGDLLDSGSTKAIQLPYAARGAMLIRATGEAVFLGVSGRIRNAFQSST